MGIFFFYNLKISIIKFWLFQTMMRLKCNASSPILRVSSPFFTSIKDVVVAKKGLHNNSGTCLSSFTSITTKSTGKMKFPTLISTSSRMPSGWAKVLSAIYRVMAMGVSSPKLSLFTTNKGIKLMLAPKSHSAFPISEFPILQGIVKLPRSCILTSKDLWITVL